MTYEAVREFAGSWMLLFMFCFFIGAVLWAFRPGSSRTHRETANMIFRNDASPAGEASEAENADKSRPDGAGKEAHP